MKKTFGLIGSAFGHGAKIHGSEKSPEFLLSYDLHTKLGPNFQWLDILKLTEIQEDNNSFYHDAVLKHNTMLAQYLSQIMQNSDIFPIVLGGDHSCGIGTWSGVTHGRQQAFGLIWIDAHLDAHTPKTSHSHYYHGMPISHLLGYGDEKLCAILTQNPKIDPENLVIIGARSYEPEEKALLDKLNVTIFDTESVKKYGVNSIVESALKIVLKKTQGFGISIDVDVFDPSQAPGTGALTENGLYLEQIRSGLQVLFSHPQLKCVEIAEFNPLLDQDNKTADLIKDTLKIFVA